MKNMTLKADDWSPRPFPEVPVSSETHWFQTVASTCVNVGGRIERLLCCSALSQKRCTYFKPSKQSELGSMSHAVLHAFLRLHDAASKRLSCSGVLPGSS